MKSNSNNNIVSRYDSEFDSELTSFLDEQRGLGDNVIEDEVFDNDINFDDVLDGMSDIDFSSFNGDLKSSFNRINKRIAAKKINKKIRNIGIPKARKPLTNNFEVEKSATIFSGRKGAKTTQKIIVPNNRSIIVQGVNNFMLSEDSVCDSVRNIGYYKGEKLQELVLTFNNNSAIDFDLELFNPSMPLDYLQSTSLNLNDKVQVAGGGVVSYTDVLHNILANPTLIANAKFTMSGPLQAEQKNQALTFRNKGIIGAERVKPLQLNLSVDTMQVQSDIIFFDLMCQLNRPFIPDGMDVISYRVLAGNTVTFAFFFKQISLKKVLFKEARDYKKLL